MLTKKKQRQYLAEKEQQWLQELTAYDASRDEEALHRLRLRIKKMRALVRLSASVRGKRLAKDFRLLRKMFRQAGYIRDTRSELNLLEAHQLLSAAYKERRVNQIRAASDKFARGVKKFRKKGKKAGRLLLGDVRSIRGGRIRRWFAEEIVQTGILLTKSGEELHEARKKIKTLLYVIKILPPRLAGRLQLDTDYLDTLQDAIGKWHDVLVASSGNRQMQDGGDRLSEECREKEQSARALAQDFYRKVHR